MKKLSALTLKAKIIIAATSAAVVAAGTVGTVMLLNNKEESYRVVKVFETQGQYNTVDRGTSGTLDAYSGMNLQNGDVVTTGVDSNMRISLDGDKYILIDHNSEVQLVAESTAKDSKTVIELKKGEILNEITEPLSENSTYEVNTPKATMAVRGTSFYVQTEELDNGSYMTDLEVVHGKVAVWLYDENGDKKGDEVYVSEGYKVTIVIDPNESSENTPDVDGNAYFVYRTDDGGFIECKDIDPAPYKTDFSLMPDLIKQTALASDDSGLLKLDVEIEKILRGEEVTETTTTAPTETSETESSTETSEISETTPETTTVADETSAPESSVVTEMPSVTTDAPVPSETTVPQESAPTESEVTVPSVTTAPPETVTTTETTTAATETTTETSSETTTSTITTAEPESEVATVLFADRSGNIVEQKKVEVGESIGALPAVPTVEGHTGKWTVDGEEITADYVVMGDVTALAVYTANKYTVTFETEASGVTMPEAVTADYGSEITLPALPTKTGYTGVWVIDGEEVTGKYTVTDDVTVTAVYTINTYTVTFESEEDVDLPENLELEYNTVLSKELPDVPTKFGYTGEWQIGGKAVTDDYKVTGNVTVTAVYTINTYTVTFTTDEPDITDLPEEQTVEYNETITLPEVPTKTGYTGKWVVDGEEVSGKYTVTEDVTITAVYTINTYTVTYVCEGADEPTPEAKTVDYNTEITLPEVPAKTGYTGEWTLDDGTVVTGTYTVTEDVTITAYYTINTYTVTYVCEGADEQTPPADTADYNTKITLPEVPKKTGYTGEWQLEDGTVVSGEYTVTEDVTITAVYTINKYTVTFESEEDVELPVNLELEYNTVLSSKLPEVPDLPGHTGEWQIGGKAVADDYRVTENVTVTAVYTINTYTVTFTTDEPGVTDIPEAKTVEYNSLLELPEVPEKTGYTGKWTIDGKEIAEGYKVTEDLTVTAVYTINTYTVSFECDDETLTMPEKQTADYGTQLSEVLGKVQMPDKEGYTGKWTIGGEDITANDIVEDNITITAVYKHIEVRVYVDYVGGYSDDGNFDPSSLRLVSYADSSTFEYIMTAEELQIQISEWKNSASDYYTVAKAVYLNDERSLSGLDNPFDIEGLPEITENTLVKDIAYDYEYEGTYQSFVRIYLVPAWENVHKVTFHDVDGEEIESQYTMGELLSDIPDAPENYTWVYTNGNDYTEEFTQDTWIGYDTDVYCGCKITVYEYTEGAWETVNSVAIQIGGALTEDNIRRLTMFYNSTKDMNYSIAGFATQAISGNEESIDLVTFSVGQTIEQDLDLYIVKAKIDYTTQNGNSGTLYWLGDGSLMDKLNALRTSENYIWKFESENGEEVSEDTLDSRLYYNYDAEPDDPQTAARFTVVEAAS